MKIGNGKSKYHPMLSGVPQGSVLMPIIFPVYITGMTLHIKSESSLHADHTKRYANPIVDNNVIQEDLTRIEQWCTDWMLPFNGEKRVALHMGKKTRDI